MTATICMLVMFACLIALGVWQVKRLAWKEGLLADLNAAYHSSRVLNATDFEQGVQDKAPFLHGSAYGRFMPQSLLIGPRTHNEQVGYHLLMPLKLRHGGVLLVNRGWIDQSLADPSKRPPPPNGDVRVTGLARRPERPNVFVPANAPALDQWYNINLPQMGDKVGATLEPYVLYAEQIDGKPTDNPATFGQDWTLPNNHRNYAIFWFMLAGLLVGIFTLRFVVVQPPSIPIK